MLTDPYSGKSAALFRNDGFDPLLIETNTSTEYWQKGASLLPGHHFQPLVAKTDADGNEVAGIRLPEIAVPLATYTGWNLYKPC